MAYRFAIRLPCAAIRSSLARVASTGPPVGSRQGIISLTRGRLDRKAPVTTRDAEAPMGKLIPR